MSNRRKGQTARWTDWGDHLRPYGKRRFWRRQRREDDKMANGLDAECSAPPRERDYYRERHPYGIEVERVWYINTRIIWRRWTRHSWYATADRRDEALSNLIAQADGAVNYRKCDR